MAHGGIENSEGSESQGDRLSLAFANNFQWHDSDQPLESLTSYEELVAWGQGADVLTGPEAERLLQEAARRPGEAEAVLQQTTALRATIYRLFSAVAAGLPPEAGDLAAFNDALSAALAQSRVVPTSEGFTWDWTAAEDALDQMLRPVVQDAADLLTSGELDRVGRCADDRCGWLFIDASRNRSRKWCSMKDCGNRAKARRHYERSRQNQ